MPGEIDIDESGFIAGDTAKLAHSVGLDPRNMDGAQSPVECLPDGGTKCCCGRSSCAWLRHSNELVEDLERDVKTAGRLGQVCGVFSLLLLREKSRFFVFDRGGRRKNDDATTSGQGQ